MSLNETLITVKEKYAKFKSNMLQVNRDKATYRLLNTICDQISNEKGVYSVPAKKTGKNYSKI